MFPAGAVQRHRANIALSKYRILFFTQSCSGSPSLTKFPESEAFSFPESQSLRCRSSSKPIKRWMLKFGISDLVLLSNQVSLQCPATMPSTILLIISGLDSGYSQHFDLVVFTFFYSASKLLTVFWFMVQGVSSLILIILILVWIQTSFRFLTVFNLLPKVFQFICANFFLFCVKVAHGSPI